MYNFWIQIPSQSGDDTTLENFVANECSGSHSITDFSGTIEFHFPDSKDVQFYLAYITSSGE